MNLTRLACLIPAALSPLASALHSQSPAAPAAEVFGYRDFAAQAKWDAAFMAVPDANLAGQHLKTLTAEPHWASSPEDYKTALYVAEKFKAAGLETKIVPYSVLLNKPIKIEIEAFDASGKRLMSGPSPEHVGPPKGSSGSSDPAGGDPFQDDPRVTPAFNGSSPSGDVAAEVVYANYGTLADFKKLAELGVSLKDKIALVRYGGNFRGVKVYIAQMYGAKGVLIYSDPADDGYVKGDAYPKGPYRPASAVQRGATQFLPIYPGDPETPGIASTPDLDPAKRIPQDKLEMNQPSIPANPLSYQDAEPILAALGGKETPREWQGGLPFTYHLGAGGAEKVTVHMHLEQETKLRTIWDVIGTIEGTDPAEKEDWVVAGNHRDAWVYGAVDPNSGTAAMLETVHGLGELLKQGWRPKRKIVIGSWDAEEEGLIGSTEWAEDNEGPLKNAVAYFNTDVGVAGPNFSAAAVPSLKQFVREVTEEVASPAGGTVYDEWKKAEAAGKGRRNIQPGPGMNNSESKNDEVHIADLGSGSDFTPFIQHLGVPSTDIGSEGPYGVYHSVFDNYNWFIKFADPTFVYEQQQARVFGLEILHMADTDVLPYDYRLYGKDIASYVDKAAQKSDTAKLGVDFQAAKAAAARFSAAGVAVFAKQTFTKQGGIPADPVALNKALRDAEGALLDPEGLPKRSWYRHTIYAPGEFTGYAAVVIPGVNEAIELPDAARTRAQLGRLTEALDRASAVLEKAAK